MISFQANDPDKTYLLNGLRHGFTITNVNKDITPVHCKSYRSATCSNNRQYIEAQIVHELSHQRYIATSVKPDIVSAIGAIPKPGKPTKFRVIHDASRPARVSLNSYANPSSFSFTTVDKATKLIKPGSYMCKN